MKRRNAFLKRMALVIGGLLLLLTNSLFASQALPAHAALTGDLGAQDPALIRQGNTYYVFSTDGAFRSEPQLMRSTGATEVRFSIRFLPGSRKQWAVRSRIYGHQISIW